MTGNVIRRLGEAILGRLCGVLARTGVPPSAFSLLGVVFGIAAGILLVLRHQNPALAAVALAGLCDFLDGGVSRARRSLGKPPQRYSAPIHVFSDKASDTAIMLGMGVAALVSWPLAGSAILTGILVTVSGNVWQARNSLDLNRSLLDRSDRIVCILLFGAARQWNLCLLSVCFMNLACLGHRAYLVHAGRYTGDPVRSRSRPR